jgi:hypothetical protein
MINKNKIENLENKNQKKTMKILIKAKILRIILKYLYPDKSLLKISISMNRMTIIKLFYLITIEELLINEFIIPDNAIKKQIVHEELE